ncbi:MAG: hypothetical protein C0599_00775 [Salinivirgaceae bacterium]|nr:MAG: hypothetical protein C0599_00775 [Salinivirgaceae bacterium]
MILIESILAGIWATFYMDFFAGILAKRKLIYPFVTAEEMGRWFVYLIKGKIVYKDIHKTKPVKNEKSWYYFSHYFIGVFLAGVFFLLTSYSGFISENPLSALVFGILTIIFPWFWLLPSIGLGFIAKKSNEQFRIIKTNLINHTNFGIGLFLWAILFHDYL